jgi:hypothetical protein
MKFLLAKLRAAHVEVESADIKQGRVVLLTKFNYMYSEQFSSEDVH